MSADSVLVDTSAWIDYFRNPQSPCAIRLDRLLEEGRVLVPRVVIAELIQGARSAKELAVVEDLLVALEVVDQSEATWLEAGYLAQELKKMGQQIPLLDCYIASIARENGSSILTLDKHFEDIRAAAGIPLFKI
jgi:predicted nucleic acid-binding protein